MMGDQHFSIGLSTGLDIIIITQYIQGGVREMVMVLFDMGDEVFREVKLPNGVARKRRALLELKDSELGKSL